jgi:mRNA-degrading endonuclease YafQ of YafQ-DinJ toxin-antitoxin module
MNIDFSPPCRKKLALLKTKNVALFHKATKQLKLFQLQPDHPSLRLHKLSGKLEDGWSISVTRSVRMVFYYRTIRTEKRAVFISIGTHDEVYR